LAKQTAANPNEIAGKIADSFNLGNKKFATASVKNGFINFVLQNAVLQDIAAEIMNTKKLPLAEMQKKTIFFDYGGANVAKELHIGHLRSPIIGEALKRTFEAFGCTTIADVYLGDWGLQMGLVIAEIMDRKIDVNKITVDDLGEIYPTASKRKNNDTEFYNRAAEITAKLQKLQEPYYSMWQILRKLSVEKIAENYGILNCTFDYYNGESTYQKFVDEVLLKLKQQKLSYESQGAVVVNVATDADNKPMPPIILTKSNGGDLYATSDVAALYARYAEFTPDQFIYTPDNRQILHFEQVFRCAKLANFIPTATALTHIPYGTINGPDGKPFKTRDGGTIKLEDIIKLVTDTAFDKLVAGGYAKPDRLTARKIGVASLKFGDLINNVRRDYIFDIEKCVSFEGKTGAYILYTVARINSLFKKIGGAKCDFSNLDKYITPTTRDIIIGIIKLAESYSVAVNSLSLNSIAEAIYNLANSFSVFYANNNISNESDKAKQTFLISVAALTKTAIEFGLKTLAIDTVENM
jgi:arginyl-tRNA synthetase